jgi:hypothetical protein
MFSRTVILLACLVFLAGIWTAVRQAGNRPAGRYSPSLATGPEDDPGARWEMEFLMLRDPRTNSIPADIRARELKLAAALTTREDLTRRSGSRAVPPLSWTERGPNNIGGRTRVFAIDVANPNTLIAGAVAGGLWKSTNDGISWAPTTQASQNHTTTCIAQDGRSGHTSTWYVGTGEFRGSTNNDTRWGSLYRGDGILKSTDNGSSWTLLPSTSSGTPNVTDAFDYCWNVAVNPARMDVDEVLVATYIGIYRSLNGGDTWQQLFASDSSYNDAVIGPDGTSYVSFAVGGVPRIWRAPAAGVWTDITPVDFPSAAGRMVIGVAPSDPTQVFIFLQGANTIPSVGGHQLWKYTYISGDGAGGGGLWENRSDNLPGDINSQAAYDMIVQVKPDDQNTVLIGGTNLYRSTDAFLTTGATTTIGGYDWYYAGDRSHHPDIHGGAFRPGNPSVYYSTHDGGISKTLNVMDPSPTWPTVTWTSLNNGYNVTQFYSVSIAPESGSDLILAGAQDNGTLRGNASGNSAWDMAYGGDGTVVEVAPPGDDRMYTQYQFGGMQRMRRDMSDVWTITPSGANNQIFVTPIVLDPNNSSLLYYAAGRSSPALTSAIWRNSDAVNATQTVGWTALAGTDVGTVPGYARRITAMGISTSANSNVLYYGTIDGIVKRVDNANAVSPTVTDVTPPGIGGGTATGGFVRGIAVDPENSSNALVIFGNYNFQSIWYTTNGGTSWTDVEGNLAGSSGPSVRFATMFHVDGVRHVFIATSIGVLSTTVLDGGSTVWVQEGATEMGNIIVGYLDFRPSDRTLAAGTHSRGVFTTQIPSVFSTTSVSIHSGWNLISNPMDTPVDSVTSIFPSASSPAFAYSPGSGLAAAPELFGGSGYWLKFGSAAVIPIAGVALDSVAVPVSAGWNLIGTISQPLAVSSIVPSPPGIIHSLFYDYRPEGYFPVDTLRPGAAAWVKCAGDGYLVLKQP